MSKIDLRPQYTYRAKVIGVYDGDTITAEVDLGFRIKITEKFRLSGINAPEIRGRQRKYGLASRDKLRDHILNRKVILKTRKDAKGKYGRYLAEVFIEIARPPYYININKRLVEDGFAVYKEY